MTDRLLLIDADILVYQIAASEAEEFEFESGVWSYAIDLDTAKQKLDNRVKEYMDELGAERAILCFSDKENFRKELCPNYKSNRKSRKPLGYRALRDYAEEVYTSKSWPKLEADDVMGILQTSPRPAVETVIVSSDKDMMTVPGLLYRMDGGHVHRISPEEADRNWMTQTLMGDSTDGYPGCRGVGKVKARRYLEDVDHIGDMLDIVQGAFEKHDPEGDWLLQARLARILRRDDFNRQTQEVRLWWP